MRLINKGQEPPTIRDTRLAPTTNLATVPSARTAFNQIDKGKVRARLATEQGSLCAFCMRHIDHTAQDANGEYTTKIAHRTPIDINSQLALAWSNLLASCDGGQRSKGRYRTCDYAQGASPLAVDPTSKASISTINYERRGARSGLFITSTDPAIRDDVDQKSGPNGMTSGTLRLNDGDLPDLRDMAWKAFQDLHRKHHPAGPFGRDALRAFLPRWLSLRTPDLPDFLGVIEAKLR